MQNLYEIQIELEERSREMGRQRYDRRTEQAIKSKREDGTSYGSKIISKNVLALSAGVRSMMNPEGRGRPSPYLKLIKAVSPEVVAMVSLSVVVKTLTKETKVVSASAQIAQALEHEARLAALTPEQNKHYKNLISKVGSQGRDATMRLNYVLGCHDVESPKWTTQERVSLGRLLLQCIVEHTNIVQIDERNEIKKKQPTTYHPYSGRDTGFP